MARFAGSFKRVAAVAALVAAGFLVAAPSHGVTMTARAAPEVTETPSVATVWPTAITFTMPVGTPDGLAYTPLAIIGDNQSVGSLITPDGGQESLVLMNGAAIRPLQGAISTSDGSFDAFASDGTYVYWMQNGGGRETLWRATITGNTPAQPLTTDTGKVLFSGSAHDLQVNGTNLTWVASAGSATEIRAIPLAGGAVTTRTMPGNWAQLDPPWLVTGPASEGSQVQIYNQDTKARTKVQVNRWDTTTCSEVWCVTQATTNDGVGAVVLSRPDGSDQRTIGDGNADLVSTDVAQLDRFEVLSLQNDPGGYNGPRSTERVWIYDILGRRPVLVSDVATAAYAAGDFVWWSTDGANAAVWHALDLTSLGGRPR